jgi:hypothetical protein
MAIRHPFIRVPATDRPPFKNYDSRTSLVVESSLDRADGVSKRRQSEGRASVFAGAESKAKPDERPNQSMKPTAPPRNNFSVFATTPCRGLSLSR